MVKLLALIFLAEVLTAMGQLLFKKSTNTLDIYSLGEANNHFRFLTEVLAKPSVWLGAVSMAAGLVVWLAALAQGELSLVFSIGSLQYILILFLARIFLGEKLDAPKVIGTLLVMFGIILITLS